MSPALRAVVIGYLLVQASGIVAWWVWLHVSAAARARFAPAGSEPALMAFAPGDLLLLAGVALVAAVGVVRRAAWAGPVLWLHAGAGAYAACWAFSLAVHEPGRAVGGAMMAPVLLASLAAALWWTRAGRSS